MQRMPFPFMAQPCIALDLGTANTRVYSTVRDEMTEISSWLRLVPEHANDITDEYVRYTNDSLRVKPLRGGVITDLNATVKLLRPLIKKSRKLFLAPAALASAPTDSTERERGLLLKALRIAGASHVSVIPEVLAAAHGAGLDTTLPSAQALVDIGDGVTDLAVFRDGQIIFRSAIRTACSDLHRAVRSAIVAKYNVMLEDRDIERLVDEALAVVAEQVEGYDPCEVTGIDIIRRRTARCFIRLDDAVEALAPVVRKIIGMIETSLARLPDDVYCGIIESGIMLTGGGACIRGIDKLIEARTNIDVRVAPDPIHAVIIGVIATLKHWKEQPNWWESISWPLGPATATI